MENILSLLQSCRLFAPLSPDQLQQYVLPLGRLRQLEKDQQLLEPQQKLEQFGIVLEGRVQTIHLFADGNYSLVSTARPGSVFGADLMSTRSRISPYHASAAVESLVFFLPVELVTEPGLLPPELRTAVLEQLLLLVADHNMQKDYQLAILAQKGLRQRIMTYLTMQAKRKKTNTFRIPFDREELARFLCVNRSALSHELSLLQQEGVLQFHKDTFTLLPEADSSGLSG